MSQTYQSLRIQADDLKEQMKGVIRGRECEFVSRRSWRNRYSHAICYCREENNQLDGFGC